MTIRDNCGQAAKVQKMETWNVPVVSPLLQNRDCKEVDFRPVLRRLQASVAPARAWLLVAAGLLVAGTFWAQTSKSVWDGVYTEEQAKRGEVISKDECVRCHGQGLAGGEQAPPLEGAGFLSNWNGSTVGDLFERIRVSMPTDGPGRLTRQEDADVLAYMLSLNRFPAGKTPLDKQTDALKQIKFEATKPN